MARIRSIKPEFSQSESMGRVSRDARLLFVSLWPICDDHGRTRGASRMLASLLFPYDDDAPRLIGGWLDELEREGCILRYEVDGSTYLEVQNWAKHQKIDKPSKPQHPEPTNPREHSRAFGESSKFLHVGSGIREEERDQGKEREGKGEEAASAAPSAAADPPTPMFAIPKASPSPSEFLAAWNEAVPFAPVRVMSEKRADALRVRRSNPEWQRDWREALSRIRGSPFLRGENDSGWKADADWFLKPESVNRILEGKYDGTKRDDARRNGRVDDDDHLQRMLASIQHSEPDAGAG